MRRHQATSAKKLPWGYERRYSRGGSVAHAVNVQRYYPVSSAPCGFMPEEWLGTGTQDEYERASTLPLCKTCDRLTQGVCL